MAAERRRQRVVVVGAGAAGLCAARHLLARPVAFEAPVVLEAGDRLGGTWVYAEGSPAPGAPPRAALYRHLRTNLPKEVMAFPDFPFDADLPSFLPHSDVLAYLERYAAASGVLPHIRFLQLVEDVSPAPEGGWAVTSRGLGTGGRRQTEHFDAVMVCTGHYATPILPDIPGLDTFTGQVLHSHEYRHPEPFAGLSVVLLGAGPSGVDLAQELAPLARSVTLSHRPPPVPGLPAGVIQAAPVRAVRGAEVLFADGTASRADALLLCTGYAYSFPFLPAEALGLRVTERSVTPLYRHMLPPCHPTLALVGLCSRICPFAFFHCQVLFFLAVLAGACNLPPGETLRREAQEELERYGEAGGDPRHLHRLGSAQWAYCAELARLGGFAPLPPVLRGLYEATRRSWELGADVYRRRNYRVLDEERWEVVGEEGDREE
ncbi:uncharacterized protein [Struthio camelus]|uniref:uncharacterized protein n=1 Tax=Struthio camelus TaxID=8801 RepID=UPI003603B463